MTCEHCGLYKDDFLGEWHCDDCGQTWPTAKALLESKREEEKQVTSRQREILVAARERIADPERWTTGQLSDEIAGWDDGLTLGDLRSGTKWCASGAIGCEVDSRSEWSAVTTLFLVYFDAPLELINDGRTHEEVLAFFDQLIAKGTP